MGKTSHQWRDNQMNPYVYSKGRKNLQAEDGGSRGSTLGPLVKSVFSAPISVAAAFAIVLFAAGSVASLTAMAYPEISQGDFYPSNLAPHTQQHGLVLGKNTSVDLKVNGSDDASVIVHADAHHAGTNIISDGTIFMIVADGLRRPFTSAGSFLSYGFNSWNNVEQANSDDLTLPVGDFIPPRDGKIVCSDRGSDKGTCYLITNGKKAGFTSEDVFNKSGFNFKYVLYGDVSFLPETNNINNANQTHLPGTLINDNGTVKLIGAAGTIGVPSMETLKSWGYSLVDVTNANTADKEIPQTDILAPHTPGQLTWSTGSNNAAGPTPSPSLLSTPTSTLPTLPTSTPLSTSTSTPPTLSTPSSTPATLADVCRNIAGTQTNVPSGLVLDLGGNCVAPAITPTPSPSPSPSPTPNPSATTTPTPTPTPDTTAPSTPTGLSATPISPSQINLSWNTSSDNVGVYGYKVYRNGSYWYQVTLDNYVSSLTVYSDTGLTSNTSYSYYIKAFDSVGNVSSASATVSATTPSGSVTCSGLNLTFQGGKTSYIIGETVTYTYTCTPGGSASYVEIQVVKPDSTATTYNSASGGISTNTLGFGTSNLVAGSYTLRACFTAGCSSVTASLPFTITSTSATPTPTPTPTPTYSTPPVVSSVSVSSITSNSAVISWATDVPATGFVNYGSTPNNWIVNPENTSYLTSHSFTISNLAAGSLYNFRVYSHNAYGNQTDLVNGYPPNNTFTTPAGPVSCSSINLTLNDGKTTYTKGVDDFVNYTWTCSPGGSGNVNMIIQKPGSLGQVSLNTTTNSGTQTLGMGISGDSYPTGTYDLIACFDVCGSTVAQKTFTIQ